MAGELSGSASETNGASRLDLPHLTRRELLSHRAKLERAIARGRTEAGTALLAQIEAELEARRIMHLRKRSKRRPAVLSRHAG